MSRSRFTILLLSVCSLFYLSCSTSQQASNTGSERRPGFPGWFSGSNTVTDSPTGFTAYGMAVVGDSAAAAEKAVKQAQVNLEQHISGRLESVREDAAKAGEDDSGLESSSFIFALRNAESGISEISTVSRARAQPNGDYGGYRGFAEVTLDRQELIDYMDSRLSNDQAAWNALKKGLNGENPKSE